MNENFLEVYRFILAYKLSHDGNSPTVREIVEGTAYKSTSAVRHALERLQKEGLITTARDIRSRMIRVRGSIWLSPEKVAELVELVPGDETKRIVDLMLNRS